MLEAIRTFFGRLRGEHGERKTVVQEGLVWRCSNCYLIFTTKLAGEQHDCKETWRGKN
jgi:Zn-finger protein